MVAPDAVVLGAAEPAWWVDEDAPTLAVVSSDATRVSAMLRETDAGYFDPREDDDVIPRAASVAPAASPTARRDFAMVLSAREATRGLYVLGGRDSVGRWSDDVWRFDDASRLWERLPMDSSRAAPSLRIVEAATMRPWDRSLYAITRAASHGATSLVRINAMTGERTEVARWHACVSVLWDRYRIANTPEGRLAIAASNARGIWMLVEVELGVERDEDDDRDEHRRSPRELEPTVTVKRFATGRGMLSGGMVADEQGISFAVDRGGGRPAVVEGVRYEQLRRVSRWEEVR